MLKKVLVIFSAMVLIGSVFFLNNTPLFKGYANSCEVYLQNYSCSKNIISIENSEYPFVFNKKGESIYIESEEFELHSFLLQMQARLIFIEEIGGKTSYYAYSPKIKYIQKVKQQNINLHIVIGEVGVKVGSPIIYGSF